MSGKPRGLIVGNWKMNGLWAQLSELEIITGSLAEKPAEEVDVVVCPPATLLNEVCNRLSGTPILAGAQDCHPDAAGAHTGDISAEMIADCGGRYVIVGHSERRKDHGESDALVRAKAEAALRAKLKPIICIGETGEERDAGKAQDVVESQLQASLPETTDAASLIVAYEPVWAIGTGKTPTPDDVAAVHAHIRGLLKAWFKDGADMRILYGGSVKASNAATLMHVPEVNGALVGGASLKADEFWAIAVAAAG